MGKDNGKSGVEKNTLSNVGKKIFKIPADFNAHKTLLRVFELRNKMFHNGKIDWSAAESLAIGTLLIEGFSVRLSGRTLVNAFSQRHGLRNQDNHDRYIPLNNINQKQKKFEIIDSLLSEFAVLGFEYGYSLSEPETLVIWEAQFGDFANGAQVIIDQFITSSSQSGEEQVV